MRDEYSKCGRCAREVHTLSARSSRSRRLHHPCELKLAALVRAQPAEGRREWRGRNRRRPLSHLLHGRLVYSQRGGARLHRRDVSPDTPAARPASR